MTPEETDTTDGALATTSLHDCSQAELAGQMATLHGKEDNAALFHLCDVAHATLRQ